MVAGFSQEELLRYSKQIILPQAGIEGQRKIKNASVLIIGAGGLGSPISLYLAATGVGRIGVVDCDRVELSNLQRQILYSTSVLGKSKTDAARKRLSELNPNIQIETFDSPFTSENAVHISKDFDILLDGTDNLPTRYLINDLCVLTSRPYVFGAVHQFDGQVALFDSHIGPCYRCAFGEPPPPEQTPTFADTGVFGVVPGLVGLLQATETLKIILDIGETLAGKLVLINSLDASIQHIEVQKNKNCIVCGEDPQIKELINYAEHCSATYTNEPVRLQPGNEITPCELANRLKEGDEINLIDVRTSMESQISQIPGAEKIPYHLLTQNLERLDQQAEYVVFCRAGHTSVWAQKLLQKTGFNNVRYLRGGINAWTKEMDPSSPHY